MKKISLTLIAYAIFLMLIPCAAGEDNTIDISCIIDENNSTNISAEVLIMEVELDYSYHVIRTFNNGLAAAWRGGETTAGPRGMAVVENSGAVWGFIDQYGNEIIPAVYYEVMDFSEGLAAVSMDGRYWSFIDIMGNVVIPFEYQSGGIFNDGLANVRKDDEFVFIDTSGYVVIRLSEQLENYYVRSIGNLYSEGLVVIHSAAVRPEKIDWHNIRQERRWEDVRTSYIDRMGNIVIQLDGVTMGEPFNGGIAAVHDHETMMWGFIDKTGEVIIPFEYSAVGIYSEGLIAVQRDSRWGFINRTGDIIIPLEYRYVNSFNNGVAAVQNEDGIWLIMQIRE